MAESIRRRAAIRDAGPMFSSSPTTLRRSWGAIALSAGRCRSASSTSSPNSATAPTACRPVAGSGLLGALAYFGLDTMGATEKKEMQEAIGNDTWEGRYTPAEILDYCEGDVLALIRLLSAMLPRIDLPRALLRGRYMAAVAAMEHNGTPIDVGTWARLKAGWADIQDDLIRAIDVYGVYDGRIFKSERWAKLVAALGIPWPMLESGRLDLSDDTFRQMAKSHAVVAPYRELRSSLSDLRLNDLAVGSDGRNRTILSAFQSRTGRNQPSNTRFIFGPSVWLRGLIKPPPGTRRRLRGLVAAGVRHCGCPVWRPGHAGGLPIG